MEWILSGVFCICYYVFRKTTAEALNKIALIIHLTKMAEHGIGTAIEYINHTLTSSKCVIFFLHLTNVLSIPSRFY